MTRRDCSGASNLVRAELSVALAIVSALLSGCTSAEAKPTPAPSKASYAGRWTRGDGKVFRVDDDGTKVHGALESTPADYSFDLTRTASGLEGTAKIRDGDKTIETKWRLHADGAQKLAGDKEYVDLDPATGAVLGRGSEPQEFQIAGATAPTDDKAALQASADAVTSEEDARAQEMARLQKEADAETASGQTEDAQKAALRAEADKSAAEADQEEAERQKLRASADANAGH